MLVCVELGTCVEVGAPALSGAYKGWQNPKVPGTSCSLIEFMPGYAETSHFTTK